MALHHFANDFFGLLCSAKTDSELETELYYECHTRWARLFEEVCPAADCYFAKLTSDIGIGHSQFPRK